jgi:hypothetical protein
MPLTISMPVAQLLKQTTFDTHTKAEKILAPRLASIKTYDDYASILKMFYGYFHPLEKCIGRYITKEIVSDIQPEKGNYIVAFRSEALQKINWGGNPNEAVQFEADGKNIIPEIRLINGSKR